MSLIRSGFFKRLAGIRCGGKGAGIAEMTHAYPGADDGKSFPKGTWEQALAALHTVEEQAGKQFGDAKNPLLVSVRSGAKFSMPAMMDTVLNLGLNDETVKVRQRAADAVRSAGEPGI